MKDEVKGEQGLAALALGKFEDEYEIEEAHEIAVLCKFLRKKAISVRYTNNLNII
jgi:hypothetical protein